MVEQHEEEEEGQEAKSLPLNMQEEKEEEQKEFIGRESINVDAKLMQIEEQAEAETKNQVRRLSKSGPQKVPLFQSHDKNCVGKDSVVPGAGHEGLSN